MRLNPLCQCFISISFEFRGNWNPGFRASSLVNYLNDFDLKLKVVIQL